jgi:hypothetical protein
MTLLGCSEVRLYVIPNLHLHGRGGGWRRRNPQKHEVEMINFIGAII